ncbi:MAG: hypothetical protein H7Y30_14630 [Pyrinomonadaceae bacterium]|nr:hypothetical protein [Pyrinomonadaceae bacterium]
MKKDDEKIQTKNVTGAKGFNISRPMYDEVKKAILYTLSAKNGEGILSKDLPKAIAKQVDKKLFADASVPWYATVVKLDLEARGLIKRVPGSQPQMLQLGGRTRKAKAASG